MAQLNEFVTKNKEKVTVLLFWAKWYLESAKLKEKMEEMQTNMAHVLFVWCDVDVDKEIVLNYKISKVPVILLIDPASNDV
jgi:thioredoxin-like negative regulator of GroEL